MAIALLAQATVGPLDAFAANYTSVKVDMEFIWKMNPVDRATIAHARMWSPNPAILPDDCRQVVHGRWSCDGSAEHHVLGSPDDVRGKQPQIGIVDMAPNLEGITDGDLSAHHPFENLNPILIQRSKKSPFPRLGPFGWWSDAPFPQILKVYYPGIQPKRRKSVRGGHPVEVEVYTKDGPRIVHRLEIAYDPSLGYVPRYARGVSHMGGNEPAWVKEVFVIAAKPCAAGGFVPTEWYETMFSVARFADLAATYDDETALQPDAKWIGLAHFVATKVTDRAKPVALEYLDAHSLASTPGGLIQIAGSPKELTMADIKAMATEKVMDPPKAALPELDLGEVKEYTEVTGRSWGTYAFWGAVAFILAGTGFVGLRRVRGMGVILVLIVSGGCAKPATPVAHVSAAFEKNRLLYQPGERSMNLGLIVKNDGNEPLRVFKVESGCVCRQVDGANFPMDLKPGAHVTLRVQMQDRREYEPQNLAFRFETDHGVLLAPVSLFTMPRHRIQPEALQATLHEAADWTFTIVHREVYKAGEPRVPTTIPATPGLAIKMLNVKSGQITRAPEFCFEDRTYEVHLEDRSIGLQKGVIYLSGADRSPFFEVPVVWHRLPFLSTSPDRIVLGAQPVRAFLRCPDDKVELAEVVSAPKGVKAVISSTREVTVTLADTSPGVIDGTIEVRTTAEGRPPMRIPVVRYAPVASR